MIFEARDATDLKLTAKHEAWWDALPPAGEEAWSGRAKRRRHRDSYRLALVPSKFRIGEWPDSRAFDIHHDTEPWSATDVTTELEQELEKAKRDAADAEQAKLDAAAALLIKCLPIAKRAAVVDVRCSSGGLSRHEARRLIEARMMRDWVQTGSGTKNDPIFLEVPGQHFGFSNPLSPKGFDNPILAGPEPSGGQHSDAQSPSPPVGLDTTNSGHLGTEGRPESTYQTLTPPMGLDNENAGRLIPKKPPASTVSSQDQSARPGDPETKNLPLGGRAQDDPADGKDDSRRQDGELQNSLDDEGKRF